MAEYIFVDEAGNEVRREPKGRGRNKAGAVKLADGNFQVVLKPTPVAETPAPTATAETAEPVASAGN